MGQEYSQAVRGKAKELYTVDGLTYEAVAEALAEIYPPPTPSLTQVQRWAKDEGWRSKREKLRRDLQELEEGGLEFKKRLLNKALDILRGLDNEERELDAQTMFGLTRVAGYVIPKGKEIIEEKAPELDRPALFLEDMQFIAKVLKEVDPEGLKVFARNFDLIIQRFKAQNAQTA